MKKPTKVASTALIVNSHLAKGNFFQARVAVEDILEETKFDADKEGGSLLALQVGYAALDVCHGPKGIEALKEAYWMAHSLTLYCYARKEGVRLGTNVMHSALLVGGGEEEQLTAVLAARLVVNNSSADNLSHVFAERVIQWGKNFDTNTFSPCRTDKPSPLSEDHMEAIHENVKYKNGSIPSCG